MKFIKPSISKCYVNNYVFFNHFQVYFKLYNFQYININIHIHIFIMFLLVIRRRFILFILNSIHMTSKVFFKTDYCVLLYIIIILINYRLTLINQVITNI